MKSIRRGVARSQRARRLAALGDPPPKGHYTEVLRHRLRSARDEPKAQGVQESRSWLQVFTQNRPVDILPDLIDLPDWALDEEDEPTECVARVGEDDPTEEFDEAFSWE